MQQWLEDEGRDVSMIHVYFPPFICIIAIILYIGLSEESG